MIFLNSAIPAAELVFYLPFSGPSMKSGVNTEEKLKESGIFNEHPVCSYLLDDVVESKCIEKK